MVLNEIFEIDLDDTTDFGHDRRGALEVLGSEMTKTINYISCLFMYFKE